MVYKIHIAASNLLKFGNKFFGIFPVSGKTGKQKEATMRHVLVNSQITK